METKQKRRKGLGKRALSFMMAVLLCMQLVLTDARFATTAQAASSNLNDDFPDPVFRAYVIKLLGKENDEVPQASLQEYRNVTSIDVSPANILAVTGLSDPIESLQGIERFAKLNSLDCSGQSKLTEIPSGLSTQVRNLNCSNTNLSSLSRGICKLLDVLDCSGNPNLKALDVRTTAKQASHLTTAVAYGTKTEQDGKLIYHYSGDAGDFKLTVDEGVAVTYTTYSLSLRKNADYGEVKYMGSVDNVPSTRSVPNGTVITIEAVPDENYYFTGWTRAREESDGPGDELVVVSTANPYVFSMENDMTLTAQFEQKAKISFDAAGGSGSKSDEYVIPGTKYTLPENPFTAPSGKMFDEYYVKSHGEEEPKKPGDVITVVFDTEVDALWADACQVSFDKKGTTGITGNMDAVIVKKGETFTLPQAQDITFEAPDGYAFHYYTVGTSEEKKYPGDKITVNGDVTVYANFSRLFSVSFDPGSTAQGAVQGTGTQIQGFVGDTFTFPANPFTSPAGHAFAGWYFNGEDYQPGETGTFVNSNRTYEADWHKLSYGIAIDATPTEGGTVSFLNNTAQNNVANYEYGDTCKIQATANEGYTFKYWKEGSDPLSGDAEYSFTVTEARTLTAVFEKIQCTISFITDGTEGVTGSMEPVTVEYGTTYKFPACGFTVPEGYRFGCYFAIVGGQEYQPGDSLTITGNKTFMVCFDKLYEITFLPGEVDGVAATGSMDPIIGVSDDYVKLPECTFTAPEGYEFYKWSVAGYADLSAGDTCLLYHGRTATARWQPKEFQLTFTASPAEAGNVTADYMATWQSNAMAIASPKAGWVFKCWKEGDKVVSTESYYGFTVTGERNLTAVFEKRQCSIQFGRGNHGNGDMEDLSVTYGTEYTLPECGFTPTMGYAFTGWEYNVDNKIYQPGEKVTIACESNSIFRAQWEVLPDAVTIDETNFPDENFRNWVKNCDTDNSGALSPLEISCITNAYLSGYNIKNLKGIEYLTELTGLNCNSNPGLALDLSKNVKLTNLNCSYCGLTSLDLSKNVALEFLYCYGDGNGKLTELDLRNLPTLKVAMVSSNDLSTVLTEGAAALEHLNVSYNPMTEGLNLQSNTALKILQLDGTSLPALELSKNVALEQLSIKDNDALTSLDLSKNTALTNVEVRCKNLETLTIGQAPELEGLSCYGCEKLSSLDLSTFPKLESLFCGCTAITTLDLSKCTVLKQVECQNCLELDSLTVGELPALEILDCHNCPIGSLDLGGCTALKELKCFNSAISELDLTKNPALKYVYAYDCPQLATLTAGNMPALLELKAGNCALSEFSMGDAPGCTVLTLNSNRLKDFQIGSADKLSYLALSDNLFTKLDLSAYQSLDTIYIIQNPLLQEVNLQGLSQVTILSCSSNKSLTMLDVSDMTALERLYCNEDSLSGLQLGEKENLEFLNCRNNEITVLDISGCPKLKENGGGTLYRDENVTLLETAPAKHVVTLQVDNASAGTLVGAGTWNEGETATVLAIPANGYAFKAWLENGTVVSAEEKYQFEVTADRTLKATFVKGYTVTFDGNGATGGMNDIHVEENGNLVLPEMDGFNAPENQRFDGWDLGKPGDTVVITKNMVVKALWVDDLVTMSFDANGGNGEMESISMLRKSGYFTIPECTFTPPTGYEFNYWYNPVAGTRYPGDELYASADRVMKAQWQAKKYQISVSEAPAEGGSAYIFGAAQTAEKSYDSYCEVRVTTNTGYVFKGWYEGETIVSTNTAYQFKVSGERSLVAVFEKMNYTISFDKGINGSGAMDNITVKYGETLTLPACGFTANAGYAFDGWKRSVDGKVYQPGEKVTVTENQNFTAQWKEAPQLAPVIMNSALAAFEGKIGVVFRMELPDYVKNDAGAYAIFTKNGKESKMMVSEAVTEEEKGKTLYRFTKYVVAKEYRETINIKLFDGNGNPIRVEGKSGTDYTATGVNYSLQTYVSKKKTSSDAKMAALATALEDYCTAAQIYFNYNATGLVVSDRVKAVTKDQLEGYKGVFEGTMPAGMKGRSISVAFESDNAFKMFYTYHDGVDPKSFAYAIDGNPATLHQEGTTYFLMKANVPAKNLDLANVYTISKGGVTYTVKCSVLTYARSSVQNGDEARQNLGKSLYLYNKAAKAYFTE